MSANEMDQRSYADNYEYTEEKDDGDYVSVWNREYDDEDQNREAHSRSRSRSPQDRSSSFRQERFDDGDWYEHDDRERDGPNQGNRDRDNNRFRDRDRFDQPSFRGSNRGPYDPDRRFQDRRPISPNQTVVMKGLPLYCDEGTLWGLFANEGFKPKDIRVLKRRDTGESRGFGFAEFTDVSDAIRWMEHTKGRFRIDERHTADIHYSVNKGPHPSGTGYGYGGQRFVQQPFPLGDWICSGCGTNNFKKRDSCFKCSMTRQESENAAASSTEGLSEIGVAPSDTLLLRNLNKTTTEEKILANLRRVTALEVMRVVLARDPETKASRGYAYVQMKNLQESMQLLTTLTALTRLNIEGKDVLVSYSRLPLTALLTGVAITQGGIPHLTHTLGTLGPQLDLAAVSPELALAQQQAIKNVQKTQQFQHAVLQQQLAAARLLVPPATLFLPQGPIPVSSVIAAQELALQAQLQAHVSQAQLQKVIQQTQAVNNAASLAISQGAAARVATLGTVQTPHGELPKYAPPDVTQYQYEETSGFYYDPSTGLYYDSNSQYYYNSETQQYLYWDAQYQTYLPAPGSDDADADKDKGKDKDKQEKVKVAKKIQKDMEKWAKQLNEKKTGVATPKAPAPIPVQSADDGKKLSATADAGFSILEHVSSGGRLDSSLVDYERGDSDDEFLQAASSDALAEAKAKALALAAEEDDESKLTDWHKLACLLCKRQFPTKEVLLKHQQFSDLHKKNLEIRQRSRLTADELEEIERQDLQGQYRDRAKERRQKFGLDDKAHPNRLKEKYMEVRGSTFEQPTASGIRDDNIGNKLLKGMGWQEGQGLGRANQGIVNPITQQRRVQGAGLGAAGSADTGNGGPATYQDSARAALRQRFLDTNSSN